jgi:tetratricopeptide (TPR) repeat protein
MRQERCTLLLGFAVLATGCAAFTSDPVAQGKVVAAPEKPGGSAAGQFALGRIALSNQQYDEAVRRLAAATQLDPKMIEAYNALGVAHGMNRNFDLAITAFDAALVVAPNAPHVLNNMGFAILMIGRVDDAWPYLKRSFELDPSNQRTRENLQQLAKTMRDSGRPDDVVRATLAGSRSDAGGSPAPAAAGVSVTRTGGDITVVRRSTESGALPDQATLVRVLPNVFELRSGGGAALAAASAPVPQVAAATPVREPERIAARDRAVAARANLAVAAVEVSNGVGKPNVAGRTARRIEVGGVKVVRVSDYRQFGRKTSEIHYRDGQYQAAQQLDEQFQLGARLVPVPRMHPRVDVRLVVGEDLAQRLVAGDLRPVDEVARAASQPLRAASLARPQQPLRSDGWRLA